MADNIQDRLYEVDPRTNQVTVYKIPHREGEPNGGLLAARLKDFPRHDSTSNAHSLAESRVDGHIFITPSAQRRLVEFDPETKAFTLHEMDEGFYPHTIRIDQQDRVWFTVALSNQIAMFDRGTQRFTMYDLPTRGFREWLNTRYIGAIFKLMSWGVPLAEVAAGGPRGHRHAAALRHRHHARRQGVVRAAAHRRDRLDRSCDRRDRDVRDAVQGPAPAAHRRRGQAVDHRVPGVGHRPVRSRDGAVHALRPAAASRRAPTRRTR